MKPGTIFKQATYIGVLALLSNAAIAATATCPDNQPDPINPANQYYKLTTASSGLDAVCWDYGDGNYETTGPDYVVPPGGTAIKGNFDLELPVGWQQVALFEAPGKDPGNLPGTENGVTINTDNGTGADRSGTFSFSPDTLSQDVIIVFKSGNVTNVTWGAFRLFAGFVSDPSDAWEVLGTLAKDLSNVRVFTGPTDDFLVPIPAAVWLLGSGLIGLLAIGRRRRTGELASA